MESKRSDLSSLRINRDAAENSSRIKKLVWTIIIIIIGAVLIIGGYTISQSLFSDEVEVNLAAAAYVSPSQTSAVLTASGYVVAQRKASVASKGTGKLVYLGVVEGDVVKKGQIIARLEDNDIRAQLEQAKANLKLTKADLKEAENNFNRQKELLKTNSTTQASVDAAEAAYLRVLANIDVANAQVKTAEVNLENTLIRAPFDGTVLTKNADVGEIVAPFAASASSKAAVVTIADMSSLQVEADVSESNIQKIKPDQDCEITLDAYPQLKYPGYVAKIVPTADRSKATVLVKVGFRKYDSKVLPEMSAKVLFLGDSGKAAATPMLVVPASSVVDRNGKKFIYKVNENKAVSVEVKTGRISGSYVEILSGISDGDKVIEIPNEKIKDGVKVKIL